MSPETNKHLPSQVLPPASLYPAPDGLCPKRQTGDMPALRTEDVDAVPRTKHHDRVLTIIPEYIIVGGRYSILTGLCGRPLVHTAFLSVHGTALCLPANALKGSNHTLEDLYHTDRHM